MKISEVAKAVGFVNQSYFAAAFRKKFGLAPKEYQMEQKKIRLAFKKIRLTAKMPFNHTRLCCNVFDNSSQFLCE